MEIAERRDEEMRESGNMENIKSDSFSYERYSRDLKAGLHPLRVCPPIPLHPIDSQFESDHS